MKSVIKLLGGTAALAVALGFATPATAQYYPYGSGGTVGQVLNQVFGGWGYNGYGPNTQLGVQQCAAAVTQRINGGYGGYAPYGGASGGAYGGGGRVVAITHADGHSRGRVKVKGIATSGMAGGYGYGGYGAYGGDLRFNCTVEYNGVISHLDINRNYGGY